MQRSARRLGAATALLLIAGARASQAATPIFVVDTDTASTSLIFRVDPATGHLTTLMSLAASYGQVLALAAASDNLLYAVASNGDVLQLTVTPPTLTTLGNIGAHFVAGLEYSGGQLYAIDEATDALSTIQLAPVVQTTIGVIHVGSPSGRCSTSRRTWRRMARGCGICGPTGRRRSINWM